MSEEFTEDFMDEVFNDCYSAQPVKNMQSCRRRKQQATVDRHTEANAQAIETKLFKNLTEEEYEELKMVEDEETVK